PVVVRAVENPDFVAECSELIRERRSHRTQSSRHEDLHSRPPLPSLLPVKNEPAAGQAIDECLDQDLTVPRTSPKKRETALSRRSFQVTDVDLRDPPRCEPCLESDLGRDLESATLDAVSSKDLAVEHPECVRVVLQGDTDQDPRGDPEAAAPESIEFRHSLVILRPTIT